MTKQWVLLALLVLTIGMASSFTAQNTQSTKVDVKNSINLSNNDIIDMEILSLEIYNGSILESGTLYQIKSSAEIVFLKVSWKINGFVTKDASILSTNQIIGDMHYAIDGDSERLALESGPIDVSDSLIYNNTFAIPFGVHTFSMMYFANDDSAGLLYDTETIHLEVRRMVGSFGFSTLNLVLNSTLTDVHQPNSFNKVFVKNSGYTGEISGIRYLDDGSSYNYLEFDQFSQRLSIDATVNSSGTLDYQNNTGSSMVPGELFFFDFNGPHLLNSLLTEIVIVNDRFTTVSMTVLRHAGYGVEFSNLNQRSNVDLDLLAPNYLNGSYDAILEENLIYFSSFSLGDNSSNNDSPIDDKSSNEDDALGSTSRTNENSNTGPNLLISQNIIPFGLSLLLLSTILRRRDR